MLIDVASDTITETPEQVAATIAAIFRLRAGGTALSLHELRYGADAPGHRF